MCEFWQSIEVESRTLKDPYERLRQLRLLYKKFDDSERSMADRVLCEWVLSEDGRIRYDAMVMVRELGLRSATDALRKLANRLSASSAIGSRFELKTVTCLIEALRE